MDARRLYCQLQGIYTHILFSILTHLRNAKCLWLTHHLQLETDPALLIPKSRAALARYGHQLVIGNELHRRKYEVVFVERTKPPSHVRLQTTNENNSATETPPLEKSDTQNEEFTERWLRLDDIQPGAAEPGKAVGDKGKDGEVEIEELIVTELINRHQQWIEAKA